jgi:hypothetical protein
MKLFLIMIAFITLTILGFAITPADVVRLSKLEAPQALDLRNTDPIVFNSSAFSNANVTTGRLDSTTPSIPQNDVGTLDSQLSFLQKDSPISSAEQDSPFQEVKQQIIHGSSTQTNSSASQNKTLTNQST